MTRKRFIKLCMSKGYSRNYAVELADDVIADGMSYDQGMETVLLIANIDFTCLCDAMSRAVEGVTEAVRQMAVAVGQGIETIGRNIREAFER